MIDADALTHVEKRFEPIVVQTPLNQIESARTAWLAAGLSVHQVRGDMAGSAADLFEEFQTALEFPAYFGHNWNAFNDCITDLSWLQVGTGIVLVFTEPSQVLVEPGSDDLRILIELLASAADEWARPVSVGEWWDRPPVPFHVVLACDGDESKVRQRWIAAGASLADAGPNA